MTTGLVMVNENDGVVERMLRLTTRCMLCPSKIDDQRERKEGQGNGQ